MIKPAGLESERFLFKITMHEMSAEKMKQLLLDSTGALTKLSELAIGDELVGEAKSLADKVQANQDDLIKLAIERDAVNISEEAVNVFYLPVPNSLNEEFSQSYEDNSFNFLQVAAEAFTKNLSNGAVDYVNNKILSTAKRSGISFDPNLLSVYNTSEPRQFQANWKFIPKSKKQYDSYVSMIEILRDSSKAYREAYQVTSGGALTLYLLNIKYVYTLNIIDQAGNETLTSLLMSAGRDITEGFFITNVTTTVGTDQFQTYKDGSPKEFSLQITFRERKPLWREDWIKKVGKMYGDSAPTPTENDLKNKYE